MKKRTQRIIVIVLAVALALSVLLPALSVIVDASSATQNQISSLKEQISSNSAQIKEIEAKLETVQAEKASAMEQKTLLEQKIALLNEQIEATEAVIEEYDGLIEEKEVEIADLEEQEAAQYELFCQQTRDMEETGSVSYLSILFSAASFTELLDYAMLISEVMEYHNGVIDALVDTQNQLAAAKEELEASRAEQEELKAEQESNKSDLEVQKSEVNRLIAEIQAKEDEYQEELDKYEEESDKLNASLKEAEAKYQKELAALEAQNVASGEWYWPLPGRYYISSTFAYRYHPITGKWSHHTGNDIPAPSGTEIHVANTGVVTEVGYSSVYGNYIRVSHGNGYSTFYAHMKSKAIVAEGATVTKGQVVGYVGTTGYSTGNHLHFELWIDGSRADSLKLYPNLTFTY